ncbi:hypothetical protein C8A05DRAFT_29200 [Staphylotrichum tortipilum]|uniref:FAD dependent oxidoreductase domain-containing protein n=1 Tax=Staphylotrichum tortipilum TaxID=2831512 RepID=A0AAN6RXZ8_9PEZI|nr:hypothetical protein C8A05DRAFT_29200 [Staphylotrichum longicolle]
MRALHATHPATAGITLLKGIEYLEAPGPEYLALSTESSPNVLDLPGFRKLDPSEFPADGKVTWGCEYDTWCVSPMLYCAFLLRRFVLHGGRVVEKEVKGLGELFEAEGLVSAFSPADTAPHAAEGDEPGKVVAVINASGTSKGLVDDPNMTVTRGQTVLVAEACDATVTRQNADGSWTFCVPRGFEGGTVIGGTKELGNMEEKPSMEAREELLRKFGATHPKILNEKGGMTVLRDIVGRRPTRTGGPRVEGEVIPGAGFVMHAYGLGGRGYELSWGVAEAVVEGVNNYLKEAAV